VRLRFTFIGLDPFRILFYALVLGGTMISRLTADHGRWAPQLCTAISVAALCGLGATLGDSRADAQLNIIATFGNSINNDSNGAAIKAAINQAIAVYGAKFVDPISVNILFSEMNGGLGQSSTYFNNVSYATYLNALKGDKTSADDNTAVGLLPNSATNPVTGGTTINVKTANLRAVGLTGNPGGFNQDGVSGNFDGAIGLNTHITTVGSVGTTGQYSLLAVIEHEIDEVLGLGSGLPNSPFGTIFPQDLFRYDLSGNRNYTTAGDNAYFSIDGTTQIARFNNVNNGGDYGDWHMGGTPQVQDAFATAGSFPTLGSSEIRALDVIGYTVTPAVTATPEFGSVFSLGGLLLAGGAGVWLKRRRSKA
jgi:LPXTG-motif cell wall-anchored protein